MTFKNCNSRQLDRRLNATRNTTFCKWLQLLAAEDEVHAEQDPLNEEEEAAALANTEEFEHVDISNGLMIFLIKESSMGWLIINFN